MQQDHDRPQGEEKPSSLLLVQVSRHIGPARLSLFCCLGSSWIFIIPGYRCGTLHSPVTAGPSNMVLEVLRLLTIPTFQWFLQIIKDITLQILHHQDTSKFAVMCNRAAAVDNRFATKTLLTFPLRVTGRFCFTTLSWALLA